MEHERHPAVVVPDARDHARPPHGGGDAHRRLGGAADRLLAEHVLAGLGGGDAQLLVEHVRGGDDDDVDIGVLDDRPPVLGRLGEAEPAIASSRRAGTLSAQLTSTGSKARSGNSVGMRRNDRLCAWPIQPKPITPMPIRRAHRRRSRTSGLTTCGGVRPSSTARALSMRAGRGAACRRRWRRRRGG